MSDPVIWFLVGFVVGFAISVIAIVFTLAFTGDKAQVRIDERLE